MKTFGTVKIEGNSIVIRSVPHVRATIRRLFRSASGRGEEIRLALSASNCEAVEWLCIRYPHEGAEALAEIEKRAFESRLLALACDDIRDGKLTREIPTKIPLRDYQKTAVELAIASKGLVVGDDVGLGKTAVAFGIMAAGFSPAVVACQTHLQAQWTDEAEKFLDGVKVHVVKNLTPYDLPEHDLLICPYSKLREWGHVLTGYKLAAFDEAQELRKRTSAKYQGAAALANACEVKVGLTATPVYNYGDEIFSVIDVLSEGALGTFDEFVREWAVPWGVGSYRVQDPPALHSFLHDQNLMIRRRRSEVGRELPPKTRVVQTVDYDKKRIERMNDKLVALAKTVVSGEFTERGRATRELSIKLRKVTGVAKAPAVADVVKDLVGAGEAPVVFGWHREFYAVLDSELRRAGIKTVLYTGSESPKQKIAAVKDFVEGRADVFVLSLRSGAGLNGLQERASIAVFGELDWSPQVHLQGEGRLARDGQNRNVTSLFLVANGGSDPVVAHMLGIKEEQAAGIIGDEVDEAAAQVTEARGKALAEELLSRSGK